VWIYLRIKLCKKQGKSGKIQNENVGYRGGNVKISKCENEGVHRTHPVNPLIGEIS
jgi:hypothetical protein